MPRGLKIHLLALAVFLILVLCSLGPIHPGQQVWGGGTNDVVNFLGNLVWQAQEAAGGVPVSRHTGMLLYPDGGAIWPPDLLGGTAIIPAVWLLGPLPAYNLLVLLNLVFACWAMFWLVRRLTGGDNWVALLCGSIYGLAPVTLGHVHNGIMEQVAAGWLPLFVGAVHGLVTDARNPGRRRTTALWVLAVALSWWAASVSSHWYHGVYASLMFGLLLVGHSVDRWLSTRRPPLALWVRGAAALGLFAALVIPVALWFVTPYESDASLMRALQAHPINTPEVNADVAYLFAPRPPIHNGDESFLHVAYLGFIVPLLALAGLARAGRRRALAAWLALALLWAVLALGPRLVFGGLFAGSGGGGVGLPYAWLARVVPIFGRMDFPYRCVLMTHLCLAVAAGLGLGGLWPNRRWRIPALAGLAALVWLETALWSGATLPAPHQALSPTGPMHHLASQRSALLDLPLRLRPTDSRRFAINQLFHQRPIPYTSFITTRSPFSTTLARESLVINLLYLASQPRPFPPRVPLHWQAFHGQMGQLQQATRALACVAARRCDQPLLRELRQDRARLITHGFGHVVLHTDLLEAGSRLPNVCAALFGPPTREQDRVWVYRLRSGAE